MCETCVFDMCVTCVYVYACDVCVSHIAAFLVVFIYFTALCMAWPGSHTIRTVLLCDPPPEDVIFRIQQNGHQPTLRPNTTWTLKERVGCDNALNSNSANGKSANTP